MPWKLLTYACELARRTCCTTVESFWHTSKTKRYLQLERPSRAGQHKFYAHDTCCLQQLLFTLVGIVSRVKQTETCQLSWDVVFPIVLPSLKNTRKESIDVERKASCHDHARVWTPDTYEQVQCRVTRRLSNATETMAITFPSVWHLCCLGMWRALKSRVHSSPPTWKIIPSQLHSCTTLPLSLSRRLAGKANYGVRSVSDRLFLVIFAANQPDDAVTWTRQFPRWPWMCGSMHVDTHLEELTERIARMYWLCFEDVARLSRQHIRRVCLVTLASSVLGRERTLIRQSSKPRKWSAEASIRPAALKWCESEDKHPAWVDVVTVRLIFFRASAATSDEFGENLDGICQTIAGGLSTVANVGWWNTTCQQRPAWSRRLCDGPDEKVQFEAREPWLGRKCRCAYQTNSRSRLLNVRESASKNNVSRSWIRARSIRLRGSPRSCSCSNCFWGLVPAMEENYRYTLLRCMQRKWSATMDDILHMVMRAIEVVVTSSIEP